MDVGSTKRDVVDAARRVLKERVPSFVPAHPITGKEVAGVHNADAALYAGRQVILTPLPQTLPELVQKATDVWAAIGAQVLRMTPENHDAAFASVSHLPHLLAFAYFSAVVNQPAGRDFLSLAGPGFRDFTRIAASDPTIWRDILMANREEILKQSARFRHTLDAHGARHQERQRRRAGRPDQGRLRGTRRLAARQPARRQRQELTARAARTPGRARHVRHRASRLAAAAPRRRARCACPGRRASPTACCCWPA